MGRSLTGVVAGGGGGNVSCDVNRGEGVVVVSTSAPPLFALPDVKGRARKCARHRIGS